MGGGGMKTLRPAWEGVPGARCLPGWTLLPRPSWASRRELGAVLPAGSSGIGEGLGHGGPRGLHARGGGGEAIHREGRKPLKLPRLAIWKPAHETLRTIFNLIILFPFLD